jgi:transposase-like protein
MTDILLIVVIGGMGTMYGAVVGAALFILAQNYLKDADGPGCFRSCRAWKACPMLAARPASGPLDAVAGRAVHAESVDLFLPDRDRRQAAPARLQRWRCIACGRSFNALTGTPLARLRKREAWLPYLQCILESRTVRDAAQCVGVHRTTSFRWRHRFVPGAARERPLQLSAIVEADETYRLESQKGSRHLTRAPRRRGGVARRRGINGEHDCLLVARTAADRHWIFIRDVDRSRRRSSTFACGRCCHRTSS